MMKKLILSFSFFLFGISIAQCQVKAIFVNDNSDNEENSLIVFGLLEQYLGTIAYFDAVQQERSPDYSELEPYNLVIWYCGTDEDELYFWDGDAQGNPNLTEFLNNKGNLWLMGRGFLNARYIKPPRTFNSGTFMYDYLGVNSWLSESATSDNGSGSPELARYPTTPLTTLTLETIEWNVPFEPYVDGCGLVEDCYNAYVFAPEEYPLYGQPTAFYFSTPNYKNTTFTFDPAAVSSTGILNILLIDVLRFYEDVLSDIDEIGLTKSNFSVYPNPASNFINVEFFYSGNSSLTISSPGGTVLTKKKLPNSNNGLINFVLPIQDFKDGIYLLSIETEDGILSRKFIVNKAGL
jgi:hypothetical protein